MYIYIYVCVCVCVREAFHRDGSSILAANGFTLTLTLADGSHMPCPLNMAMHIRYHDLPARSPQSAASHPPILTQVSQSCYAAIGRRRSTWVVVALSPVRGND